MNVSTPYSHNSFVLKAALLFLFSCLCFGRLFGQVLVSGTEFNPVTGKENETYFSLEDVQQYGLSPGKITTTTPFHSGSLLNFDSSYRYLITDNPTKINEAKFKDLRMPDNMLIASFPSKSPSSTIFNYAVTDLVPGSVASVMISFCSVHDTLNIADSSCAGMRTGINISIGNQIDFFRYINKNITLLTGSCSTLVVPAYADMEGSLTLKIAGIIFGNCSAIGISKIEIIGKPFIKAFSKQTSVSVCAADQITLESKHAINGTLVWQTFENGKWLNIGSDAVQKLTVPTAGNYKFRYLITTTDNLQTFASDTISTTALLCCKGMNGDPIPRQTLFYDDFGTLDLETDITGKTYKVWDYTDPAHPKQITKTSPYTFRWEQEQPPVGSQFAKANSGPIQDGQYVTAAYLTGITSYKGIAGARLSWANNITGSSASLLIGYDYSGTVEGGVLLINNPFNSSGTVVYRRDFLNLCTSPGKVVYFECFISVFTPEEYGVDVAVKLNGGSTPVTLKGEACSNWGSCFNPGKWTRIMGQVEVKGNSLTLEIINNAPNSWNLRGNDLVIDDIKLYACESGPCPVLGLEEKELKSSTTLLYPNPTNDLLQFDNSVNSYTIYNALGELQTSGSTSTLSVAQWQSGIYQVALVLHDGTSVQKKFIRK